jgi:hypothetical protein
MHALVGYGGDPLPQLRVHLRQTVRLASLQSAKKIPAQILHPGFYLAFGLRAIRPAQPWRESSVARKI